MFEEKNNKRRILGNLLFLDGLAEAMAAGAELCAAGFECKITDDCDPYSDARFMIVWRDEINPKGMDAFAVKKFRDDIAAIVGACNLDNFGVVEPDYMPARTYQ